MALNDAQAAKARSKAIEFLELNITQLALTLNVLENELGESYVIPVAEDDPQYKSYLALNNMAIRLSTLTSS